MLGTYVLQVPYTVVACRVGEHQMALSREDNNL